MESEEWSGVLRVENGEGGVECGEWSLESGELREWRVDRVES